MGVKWSLKVDQRIMKLFFKNIADDTMAFFAADIGTQSNLYLLCRQPNSPFCELKNKTKLSARCFWQLHYPMLCTNIFLYCIKYQSQNITVCFIALFVITVVNHKLDNCDVQSR